ncbi:HNH endonuclease [uncultured Rummeliibacillus sp.]|nr:HNH endonuclease [uncultured Rummeliibacillus sp.]
MFDTWHHHQTRGYMQLIDSAIHSKTGHTGGNSILEKNKKHLKTGDFYL